MQYYANTNRQDIITPGYTRYAGPNEVIDPDEMLEVTLLDALRVKEINLLIVSFLLREMHNKYILIDPSLTKNDLITPFYYQIGAILGLMITGFISDMVLKQRRFLLLFILNLCLFVYDIYLFANNANRE